MGESKHIHHRTLEDASTDLLIWLIEHGYERAIISKAKFISIEYHLGRVTTYVVTGESDPGTEIQDGIPKRISSGEESSGG